MATGVAMITTMLMWCSSCVAAVEYCDVDYPEWGMSRVQDKVCATHECKETPNCTIGCIGDDIPSGCSWCVWDMLKCQSNFGPQGNDNMCAKYVKYGKLRSGGKDCRAESAPHFETLQDTCLDGPDVSTLTNDWMTVEAAEFACFNSRDESAGQKQNASNCKGFWYYPRPSPASLAVNNDPNPKVECDVQVEEEGEMLITDEKCADPTCTGDCQLGCLGTDNPKCSRCVYNKQSCDSTVGPEQCDKFIKGRKIRYGDDAPSCDRAPLGEKVYVIFKHTWDPKVGSDCPSPAPPPEQLGASFAAVRRPQARFNPATVMRMTGFLNGVQPIEGNLGMSTVASAKAAYDLCFKHSTGSNPCMGFNYSNVNTDPLLHQKASVTFMTGDLQPSGNSEEAAYFATWKAPRPHQYKALVV